MKLVQTITKRICHLMCALSVGFMPSVPGWAQGAAPQTEGNSIEAINIVGQQDGNIVVKIMLKQPLASISGVMRVKSVSCFQPFRKPAMPLSCTP